MLWLLARGAVAWSLPALAAILASGVIHLGYWLALQRGYQVADFSVVYPVARGSGPMLSSVGAVLLMGEAMTPLRLAGLAAIVAGILLISTRGELRAFSRPGGHAGVRWGTATGGLIASYTVVDAYAVKALGVAPVVLDWFGNLTRFALLAPLVARDPARALARMRGHWPLAIGVGLLVAALLHSRPRGAVARRAGDRRRADAGNVDDGRGADGDGPAPRAGRRRPPRRLRGDDRRRRASRRLRLSRPTDRPPAGAEADDPSAARAAFRRSCCGPGPIYRTTDGGAR